VPLAFLFVDMVAVACVISVTITGTNLSGVTGIAISDTAAALDPNRSYASRQKQRAHSRDLVAKKIQKTAKRRRLLFSCMRRFTHRRPLRYRYAR
jgi:hypothetical protein